MTWAIEENCYSQRRACGRIGLDPKTYRYASRQPDDAAVRARLKGWRFSGGAQFELIDMASRLSTLDALGSYRLTLQGDAAGNQATTLTLATLDGALLLSGNGQMLGGGAGSRLRFTGEASAAPGSEAALANLLNIIGRRRGPVSVISIG